MAVSCPACRTPMDTVSTLGVPLQLCPSCAGVWFEDGELGALAAASPKALELLDVEHAPKLELVHVPGRLKRCPNCSVQLESYRYAYDSPAVLDACPKCRGIFVEDQELSAIVGLMRTKPQSHRTALMKSRSRFTGRSAYGGRESERDVAALLHALRHWGHNKGNEE